MKEIGRFITDSQGTERAVYGQVQPQQPTITFPDKREMVIDWRRNLDAITHVTECVKDAELVQEEGTYVVPITNPNVPFSPAFVTSDLHIGAYTTDNELIKDTFNLILNTDNASIIDAGDTFNDGVWGGMGFEDIMPPYMQAYTVESLMKEMGEKWACTALGNHTEWMFNGVGIKPEAVFARSVKGVIFPGMGLLHYKAGNQSYDVAVTHKYWGQSKKNIFNVCVNLRQTEYPQADVFIVGHEHINGYAKEFSDGKEKHYIRPGTAKLNDRYARIHGIAKRGQPMGKVILFGTQQHAIRVVDVPELEELLKLYV